MADFHEILRRMNDPIAKDLLNLDGEDNNDIDINYLSIAKKPGYINYVPDSKVTRKLKETGKSDDVDTRFSLSREITPIEGRLGKQIQRLLSINGKKYSASDIEKFVSKFSAIQSGKEYTFEILKGEDIKTGYETKNYTSPENNSELHNSCMNNKYSSYFEFYMQNSCCSLLVCKDINDKIAGRAFLWKAMNDKSGINIMDKIYSYSPRVREIFIEWAKDNDYAYRTTTNNQEFENKFKFNYKGNDVVMNDLMIALDKTMFEKYPYIDTFQFVDRIDNFAYNNIDRIDKFIRCSSTQGSFWDFETETVFKLLINSLGIVVNRKGYDNEDGITDFGYNTDYIAGITQDNIIHSNHFYNGVLRFNEYKFDIKEGQIYKGESLFKKMKVDYYAQYNQTIIEYDKDLDGIENIYMDGTNITEIESLPEGIISLNANSSKLESLPKLPSTMKVLNVRRTRITKLPELPDGLYDLYIDENKIEKIEKLPNGLLNLNISDTLITELPTLPNSLRNLTADGSKLVSLPELKNTYLVTLNITRTDIKDIPELPETLNSLFLRGCDIQVLPNIPDRLGYMDIRNTSLKDDFLQFTGLVKKEYYGELNDDIKRKVKEYNAKHS